MNAFTEPDRRNSETPLINETPIWKTLQETGRRLRKIKIRSLFDENPQRGVEMERVFGNITLNFGRELLDTESIDQLIQLAQEAGLAEAQTAMFRGDKINTTENRSALHTALRLPEGESLIIDGVDVVPKVHAVLSRMIKFADDIHSGERKGSNGKKIKHVVNIGIGGSDLGPAMAYQALKHYKKDDIDVRYVSSVDPTDLAEAVKELDPDETLFVICSKTFTTDETMDNAKRAKDWVCNNNSSPDAVKTHFVAVSTNTAKVTEFGIDPSNMFEFWDWVGGRFSVSSAVGLSVMLGIGSEHFQEMLSGMYDMDRHYQTAPLRENIPVIMALLSIWNTNFLGNTTLMEIVYDKYLEFLPSHLQQLLVESLGKSRTTLGLPIPYQTSPLIMSVLGPNWQHSFGQGLHQGTVRTVAATFIGCMQSLQLGSDESHAKLISHMIAQADSLAFGVPSDDPYKEEPGNIPSTILTIDKLTPYSLGQVVSLFEHVVHAQAAILNINAFDQPGVKYGKVVSRARFERLKQNVKDVKQAVRALIRKQ